MNRLVWKEVSMRNKLLASQSIKARTLSMINQKGTVVEMMYHLFLRHFAYLCLFVGAAVIFPHAASAGKTVRYCHGELPSPDCGFLGCDGGSTCADHPYDAMDPLPCPPGANPNATGTLQCGKGNYTLKGLYPGAAGGACGYAWFSVTCNTLRLTPRRYRSHGN